MIDRVDRRVFAEYLNKLIDGADGHGYSENWCNVIINHYPDEELEEIRRNVVRMRIKAGDPEIFPVTEEEREQLRNWVKELS